MPTEPTADDREVIAKAAEDYARAAFGAERFRKLAGDPRHREMTALAGALEAGWLSMLVPEDLGGSGLGLTAAAVVAEAFARELAPLPVAGVMSGLYGLARCAGPRELLAPALAGDIMVLAVRTDAEPGVKISRTDGGLNLSGVLDAVEGASAADVFVLAGRHEQGAGLLAVARETQGLSIAHRSAVDGSSFGWLTLHDCRLPADAEPQDSEAAPGMGLVRQVLTAAELLGVMQGAFDAALEHLKTRRQFGKALASFQALQFRMVDAYILIASTRALVGQAAATFDRQGAEATILADAALTKAAEAAMTVTKSMVQMHGAMGFTDEHSVGLYLKRAMVLAHGQGDAAARRQAVLRGLRSQDLGCDFAPGSEGEADLVFRQEVRNWLRANLPDRLRDLPLRPEFADTVWWHRRLHARGWIAPRWPSRYGGMEASVAQQLILGEEIAASGAPEISGQAINNVGPILQMFGSEEQQARHLPGMLSGDVVWCQGYSEPGAGSDLASLKTTAALEAGHLVLSGQKTWVTWAQHADWMYALVRTDRDAERHAGITFVLVDMRSPGITVRPITTITGDDEFAEVFLDDVRVPVGNVVGGFGEGWKIANALLGQERLSAANPRKCIQVFTTIVKIAESSGRLADPVFCDRLARCAVELLAVNANYAQIASDVLSGRNAEYSFATLSSKELQQQLNDVLLDAAGDQAALSGESAFGEVRAHPAASFLQARRATIYGGTAEIQRHLIARRVLGMA